MENAESALKVKLKQLERAEEKANQALKSEKPSAIQRQLANLKELITEVDSARRAVEALKIVGSISAALSCLVYPPREERAPFPNSGWLSSL